MYIKILVCEIILAAVTGFWDCMCLTEARVEGGFGEDWSLDKITDEEIDDLRITETLFRCFNERFKFILIVDVVILIVVKFL